MTRYHRAFKRISVAALALGLCLSPTLSRGDEAALDLKARDPAFDLRSGSGAPASLIGSPVLGAPIGKLDWAGLIALELGPSGYNVGFRLTGEGMYAVMDLMPQLRLDIGGRVSWAYHGLDNFGFAGYGGSSWLLDFVPDAKVRYAINDQFGVYGDFGMGLGFIHESFDTNSIYGGGSNTTAAFTIQFGGGIIYAITPTINLLGEIRLNIYTASGSGLFVALPAVGLQFH